MSGQWLEKKVSLCSQAHAKQSKHTLVPLLLDFDLLGEVLLFLPLDLSTDSLVIDKVATVANLFLQPIY